MGGARRGFELLGAGRRSVSMERVGSSVMVVELTADEVRRAIARAAVEKANSKGFPYRWSDRVEVCGPAISAVRVQLRDGRETRAVIALDVDAGKPRCAECREVLDAHHPEGQCVPW